MKSVIIDKIQQAAAQLQAQGKWEAISLPTIEISYPSHSQHGDYASNIAMKLAKLLKKNPLQIGEELAEAIDREGIENIEVVAPGFLNFFVNEKFLAGGVRLILEQGEHFGENTLGVVDGKPQTLMIEFLSANPTGPIHLGNGRAGFTGDVLGNVFRASHYNVISEYYINDHGKQLDNLAESVLRRYLQLQGINVDYGDELYKGDYVKDLASKIHLKDVKLGNNNAMLEMRNEVKEWALQEMVKQIQDFVQNTLKIHYDVWKSERSLYEPKLVAEAEQFMKDKGVLYEQDGATFFATTRYGDDKDRVIRKSDGETTYFYSDILYLIDKFVRRHVDKWVWYLGADHHGYEGRIQAAMTALGHGGKLDLNFVQLVRLMFNGKELRMSKRKGTFVTLEELVEEVGIDVARWFFLMYDANTHMDFDLNLARERSDNNPVFYVQYAYARICSLLAKTGQHEAAPIQFTNPAEEDLVKLLFQLPEVVLDIAQTYHVHKLPQYALELARAFHKFYSVSRVIEEDGSVNLSRYQLVLATQVVLANTLRLMRVTAPTKM
jgi:arginyl-tRNA synthetase